MKNSFAAFALLGTLAQCTNQVAPSRAAGRFNEVFSLQPGGAVAFGGPAGDSPGAANHALTVRVLGATDQRCPAWVNCVTAGSARATTLVSRGELVSDTLQLCLGDCDFAVPYRETDQVSFRLGADAYVLHLKSIDSREKPGQPTRVERVNLLLEKK